MESTQDQDPTNIRRIQTRRSAAEAAAPGGSYLLMNAAATLILELDRSFEGLIAISEAPLRSAIAELNR
jgi:hypothetical protein